MKKIVFLLAGCWAPLFAQNFQTAIEQLNFYSGTNLQYMCTALSSQPSAGNPKVVSVSAISNASAASFTASSHGFSAVGPSPIVYVSGLTGNWLVANGLWAATITDANDFTIPINSSSLGAVTGTITVTTVAPRLTDAVWQVRQFYYDGSNNLVASAYGVAAPGAGTFPVTIGPSAAYTQVCANRATLSYQ